MARASTVALSLAAALVVTAGCGSAAHHLESPASHAPVTPPPPRAPAGPLSGSWQWRGELQRSDGDREAAVEDWSLDQDGARIIGSYQRTVTVNAAAGQVFACNRGDSYQRRTRFHLTGELTPTGELTLSEDSFEVAPSLCDDGARELSSYQGRQVGDRLELTRDGAPEVLTRGAAPAAGGWAELMRPAVSGDLGGMWQRVLSRRDEAGQLRTETEVWHLEPRPPAAAGTPPIAGYYDHVVTVTAAEGHRFACSAGTEYTLRTRYHVAGFLDDKSGLVYLNETSYETVPGPCENNRRRLERYEGRLAGDELLLRWGGGAELLRRVAAVVRPKN